MNITHEGTDIIGYYCMCIYFVLNKYYYIIILYGGSHASDRLHVLMGVSVTKLIIYNIVLLFIMINVLLLRNLLPLAPVVGLFSNMKKY